MDCPAEARICNLQEAYDLSAFLVNRKAFDLGEPMDILLVIFSGQTVINYIVLPIRQKPLRLENQNSLKMAMLVGVNFPKYEL